MEKGEVPVAWIRHEEGRALIVPGLAGRRAVERRPTGHRLERQVARSAVVTNPATDSVTTVTIRHVSHDMSELPYVVHIYISFTEC